MSEAARPLIAGRIPVTLAEAHNAIASNPAPARHLVALSEWRPAHDDVVLSLVMR